ncbi:hypothetical protein MYX07_04415 [Patescibacteria group bacterium AH-259-L07]|nr:hypothetical protein [Patescibacteria group bacterium AH-259-L07]
MKSFMYQSKKIRFHIPAAKIVIAVGVGVMVVAAYILFQSKYVPPAKELLAWSEPRQITKGIEVGSVHFLSDGKLLFTGNDSIYVINTEGTDMRTLFYFEQSERQGSGQRSGFYDEQGEEQGSAKPGSYNLDKILNKSNFKVLAKPGSYFEGLRRANMSPDMKKIVFDNDLDIFIVNSDGSEFKPIANDKDIFEFAISFTPDGKAITFVTIDDVNFTYGIWIMDSEGNNKRNLRLSNDVIFRHPRQSPDGTQISYFSVGKGEKPTIFVMDKDGMKSIALTNPDVDEASRQASWSPDGKQFVYSSKKSGNFDIWIMDVDGRNKMQMTSIPGDEAKPVWSPDSKSISFVCSDCFGTIGSDLYIISRK